MRTVLVILIAIALVFAQDASDSSVDNGFDAIDNTNLPTDLRNVDLGELKPIVENLDPDHELDHPVPASELVEDFNAADLEDLKAAIADFNIELPEYNIDAAAVGAIRAKHRAAVSSQLLQLLAADPTAVRAAVNHAETTLAEVAANYTSAKSEIIAAVQANISVWKSRIEDAIAYRTEALSDSASWAKRAELALFLYRARLLRAYVASHIVAAHAIATNVERLYRAAKAELIIIKAVLLFRELVANGTITVDGAQAQALFVKVVNFVAERRTWAEISLIRLRIILTALGRFNDRLKFLNDNLQARIDRLKAARQAINKVRQAFANAPLEIKERLREAIRQIIENVRDAEVTITGVAGTGDITIDITINRVSAVGDDIAKIKDEIKKLIKAYLLAETGAADDDVVITDPVVPTSKRANEVSAITTTAKISGSAGPGPNPAVTEGASSAIVSLFAALVAVAAVLF